jgi:hypothetical protein
LHVPFYIFEDVELVLCFNVWKAGFEFFLPGSIHAEGVSLGDLTFGIQFEKVFCHSLDSFYYALFDPSPISPTEAAYSGAVSFRPDVAGNPVCLMDGNVKLVSLGVLDADVLVLNPFNLTGEQPFIMPYSMVYVDHKVVGLEFDVFSFRSFSLDTRALAGLWALPAENFSICKQV